MVVIAIASPLVDLAAGKRSAAVFFIPHNAKLTNMKTNQAKRRNRVRRQHREDVVQKSSRNACKSKIISYLCGVLHFSQRVTLAHIAGIFYARTYRFRTPLQSVNAPAAGYYSVGQRVGAKPFFFAHTYCFTF